MTTKFRLHVRDKPVASSLSSPAAMNLVGEIDRFISFEAIGRHLDVGSWTMTIPAGTDQARLIKPGRGINLFLDSSPNDVAFSGPIRSIRLTKNQETGGAGLLTVSGVCDNTLVRERLARINPRTSIYRDDEATRSWSPLVYDNGSYRVPLNSGEWIWGVLVENLVIPVLDGAYDTSRRIRYLDMDPQVPAAVKAMPPDDEWQSYPMVFDSIEEAVWELARWFGLSIRFIYNPYTGLVEPSIEPARDLSDEVVFDEMAGNLGGLEVTAEAPTYTRVFLAGATPEVDAGRRSYEYHSMSLWNPDGWQTWANGGDGSLWGDPYWGRQAIEAEWNTSAESFLDVRESKWAYQSNPDDPGAALPPPPGSAERRLWNRESRGFFVQNGPKGLIAFEAIDTDECRFGRDYFIGDTVRALLDTSPLPESMIDTDGVVRQPVREVRISCKADEMWIVKPTIGTDDSSSTPYVYRKLRQLQKQVEANKNRV